VVKYVVDALMEENEGGDAVKKKRRRRGKGK
jgi:hypothetical protein